MKRNRTARERNNSVEQKRGSVVFAYTVQPGVLPNPRSDQDRELIPI
jgi:hypothetical protein